MFGLGDGVDTEFGVRSGNGICGTLYLGLATKPKTQQSSSTLKFAHFIFHNDQVVRNPGQYVDYTYCDIAKLSPRLSVLFVPPKHQFTSSHLYVGYHMVNSVQISRWLTHAQIVVGANNISAITSNRALTRNMAQTHEPDTKMKEATGPKLSASGNRPKPLEHTITTKGGNDTGELGPTRTKHAVNKHAKQAIHDPRANWNHPEQQI